MTCLFIHPIKLKIMTTSFLTIITAIFYLVIRIKMNQDTEWTDFTAIVLASNTLLSITDIMIRFFMKQPVTEHELMKPVTIGFIVILFGAYQSILKIVKSLKKSNSG
jgi:cytochrome c oxidase subunit IV